MIMVLTRLKAIDLLYKLDVYCRQHHIELPKNSSSRLIAIAGIVMDRYHSIVLKDTDGSYLCNNPKHLKKYVMQESFKHAPAFITPNCDKLAKYGSL